MELRYDISPIQYQRALDSAREDERRNSRRQIEDCRVRTSTIVMIGFAVLFGLLAVFVAQSWLNSQAEQRMTQPRGQQEAARDAHHRGRGEAAALRHRAHAGIAARDRLAARRLPAGAFATIADADVGRQARRAGRDRAERAGAVQSRSPAPGQRATLSALMRDGMKAVTIRVNDVEGVGGFVLPGDHVDVALTRQVDKTNGEQPTSCCRTRACWRSTRSPTSAPTSRRSPRR